MKKQGLTLRYPSFVLTAAVAGVFVTLVGIFMMSNFVFRVADPLETPAFLALKGEIKTQPENVDLRGQIRELDTNLRTEYFRRRTFATWGTYLLLGGLAIALITAKTAATLERRLPKPIAPTEPETSEHRGLLLALCGVVTMTLLLVLASFGLRSAYQSVVSADSLEVAEVAPRNVSPGGTASPGIDIGPKPAPTPNGISATGKEPVFAADSQNQWPRFRGFQGSGIAAIGEMPTTWNVEQGEGIAWKTEVPLPGQNSPICWDDLVFLTGATEEHRAVYCFDAHTGELRWERELTTNPTSEEPLEVNEDTGFAAPTMVTDGELVFASFANGDLAAFHFDGKEAWSRSLGIPKNAYGHASSLEMSHGMLIVQFDQAGERDKLSKLLAINADDGKTIWEVAREVPNSWASPLTIEHDGKPLIVTCAAPWVVAYDAATGEEIWRSKSLSQDVGPSPIYANNLVYVTNVFPGVSAIRPDGTGDVTESHIAWFSEWDAPDTCSPLAVGDLLLLHLSYGTLLGYDAVEGGEEPLWEEEFDDSFRSSPGLAGEHVYLFGQSGKSWVVKVTREGCTVVSENDLGEECSTSPAFHRGKIYLRGAKHLFCIGEQEAPD